MRSILLFLCGALVAAGAFVAAGATSPVRIAQSPMPAMAGGSQTALGKNIRDYLMANPEVLVEAMQELERKQDTQRDTQAQKAIEQQQSELLRDPETPSTGNPNGDVTI